MNKIHKPSKTTSGKGNGRTGDFNEHPFYSTANSIQKTIQILPIKICFNNVIKKFLIHIYF